MAEMRRMEGERGQTCVSIVVGEDRGFDVGEWIGVQGSSILPNTIAELHVVDGHASNVTKAKFEDEEGGGRWGKGNWNELDAGRREKKIWNTWHTRNLRCYYFRYGG